MCMLALGTRYRLRLPVWVLVVVTRGFSLASRHVGADGCCEMSPRVL